MDFLIATDVAARVSDASGLYGFRLFIELIKDTSVRMISICRALTLLVWKQSLILNVPEISPR